MSDNGCFKIITLMREISRLDAVITVNATHAVFFLPFTNLLSVDCCRHLKCSTFPEIKQLKCPIFHYKDSLRCTRRHKTIY